jgi:sugar phosphate isomerase/epimerase
MQAYTFHKFTFDDALDNTAQLGIRYIEIFPGQRIRKDANDTLTHDMNPSARERIKSKLTQKGIKALSYGVVELPADEVRCRKVFDFAKDLGIETIVSEPDTNAFDILDKLCQEYKINVAIHNHPKPSRYWNPETVLAAINGRSSRIGACADTGHWMRSGVNPLEAVNKLQGRVISLHFKDLNEFGKKDAHDVPWGTGAADSRSILAELQKQDFKGTFIIEYEYNWENSIPQIRQCISWFDDTVAHLVPAPKK